MWGPRPATHGGDPRCCGMGVPLEKIGLVLRHRGIDTTAYYAKADVTLLKQIAQPWPEVL